MAEPVPAAGRGTLVIEDAVLETTARTAARRAPGVVTREGTVGQLTGRSLPRVDVRRAEDHVRVRLDVALAWPTPLAATTAGVRDAVAQTLTRVTGCAVDAVDVTVTHLQPHEEMTS